MQKDFLEGGEKEINRELQGGSIHNYTAEHKSMDILWTPQARYSCCNREWCWRHLSTHLCHSLSHVRSEGQEGDVVYI